MITAVYTLSQLKERAVSLGIKVEESPSKHELVSLIQSHYLKLEHPQGVPLWFKLLERIKAPMAATPYWKLDKDIQELLFSSKRYVVQEKIHGVRMLLVFVMQDLATNDPFFSSRNISVQTFLPENYFPHIKSTLEPKIWKSFKYLPDRFILDVEYCAESNTFHAFDLLWLNGDWKTGNPYYQRHTMLESQVANLRKIGFPVSIPKIVKDDRLGYVKEVLADESKEGVIFKAVDSIYSLNSYNTFQTRWVKLKRGPDSKSLFGTQQNSSMEGFITSSSPSDPKRSNANYVGSIQLSALVKNPKTGEALPKEIVSLYILPKQLRVDLTVPGSNPPVIKEEYLGKVVEFIATIPSNRSKKLLTPRFIKMRDDRSPDSVYVEEEYNDFFFTYGKSTFLP